MNGERNAAPSLPPVCHATRERLSRFLDNDLSASDAARVVGHLSDCVACRHHYERLGAVKSAVHALPALPSAEAERARARIFARLEGATERGEGRATRPAWPTTWLSVWRPAAATLSAATLVGVGFLLYPNEPMPERAGEPVKTTAALFPGADELSLLTSVRDAHGASLFWNESSVASNVVPATRVRLLADAEDTPKESP